MWRKISTSTVEENLTIGSVITNDPDNTTERYVIKAFQRDYVRAIHADGKISIKGFPLEKLLSEDWWVQE